MFVGFIVPFFAQIKPELRIYELTSQFCILYIISTIKIFLFNYLFLHCWHNFWAEILRFENRNFYGHWWTSTSYADYYRQWNLIVHNWLHCYIYKPMIEVSKRNKSKTCSYLLHFAVRLKWVKVENCQSDKLIEWL